MYSHSVNLPNPGKLFCRKRKYPGNSPHSEVSAAGTYVTCIYPMRTVGIKTTNSFCAPEEKTVVDIKLTEFQKKVPGLDDSLFPSCRGSFIEPRTLLLGMWWSNQGSATGSRFSTRNSRDIQGNKEFGTCNRPPAPPSQEIQTKWLQVPFLSWTTTWSIFTNIETQSDSKSAGRIALKQFKHESETKSETSDCPYYVIHRHRLVVNKRFLPIERMVRVYGLDCTRKF